MSHYANLIIEKTGCDEDTADLIEELMRSERTALDGLDDAQFDAAIAEAVEDAGNMAAADELDFYCQAMDIEVPAISNWDPED